VVLKPYADEAVRGVAMWWGLVKSLIVLLLALGCLWVMWWLALALTAYPMERAFP